MPLSGRDSGRRPPWFGNARRAPNFNVKFYIVNAAGEYAGVALYGGEAVRYAVCTGNGAELRVCDALLDGTLG